MGNTVQTTDNPVQKQPPPTSVRITVEVTAEELEERYRTSKLLARLAHSLALERAFQQRRLEGYNAKIKKMYADAEVLKRQIGVLRKKYGALIGAAATLNRAKAYRRTKINAIKRNMLRAKFRIAASYRKEKLIAAQYNNLAHQIRANDAQRLKSISVITKAPTTNENVQGQGDRGIQGPNLDGARPAGDLNQTDKPL